MVVGGCRSLVAEHWRLKTEALGSIPENRAGNWAVMLPRSSGPGLTSVTFARRLRSWIAGRPNRFCSKSLTTKALWMQFFSFDEKVRVTCPKTFNGCWSGPWRALVGACRGTSLN